MSNSRQSRSFLRSVERDERRMLKGKEETKGNETCYRIHCSVSEIESNDDSLYRLSFSISSIPPFLLSFLLSEGKQTLWLDRKLVLIFVFHFFPWFPGTLLLRNVANI